MSRLFKVGLPLLLLVAALAFSFKPVATVDAAKRVPGWIVVMRDDIVRSNGLSFNQNVNSLAATYGLTVKERYKHALRGFAADIPDAAIAALSADPRIAFIERNHNMWTIQQSQSLPTGITRSFTSSNPTVDIDGVDDLRVNVDVAVIDSGIYNHSDLNIYAFVNCAQGSPYTKRCSSASPVDGNGHGTHVAGTIGAKDNGIGVVGVAPGARLWGVRVLNNSGSGYTNWIIAGIDYVTKNASSIEVANMSLGCSNCQSSAQDLAITNAVNAGVVMVVAAGNSDANASTFSPANHPDVVTVSALADFNGFSGGGGAATCRTVVDDTLADFSNYGSTVEIAAPGVCILSTWNGSNSYNTISGTSMASPHVAGAASILASRNNPNNRTAVLNIRSTLISTGNFNWTDDSGDGIKEPLLDLSNSSTFNAAMITP